MQGFENMLLLLRQSIATDNHNACNNNHTTWCDNDNENDDKAHYNHNHTHDDDNSAHHNGHTTVGNE